MIPQCMRKKCDKKCDVFLRCDEKVSQNVTKRIFLGFGFGSLVVVMMQKHQFVTKKCHRFQKRHKKRNRKTTKNGSKPPKNEQK